MGFEDDSQVVPDLAAGKSYVESVAGNADFEAAIEARSQVRGVQVVCEANSIPDTPERDDIIAGIGEAVGKAIRDEREKNPTPAEAVLLSGQLSWGGRRKFDNK